MIYFKKGNLLESGCDYICHQVNCQGKMNSGIAKQIREKWPIVYHSYLTKCNVTQTYPSVLLGDIQIVALYDDFLAPEFRQYVINLFAQDNYGYNGKRYTSYDAFWNCLNLIKRHVPKGSRIGFPKGIGCGLGGANWQVIETMIYEVLDNDFKVEVYDYE